ncbi:unnamed protein product [Candidula unifasciata]|uniref:RNA polymerase I-specific transcription initiation factor RRN3 n=1 Tax=Candidula unifasciata TaxID=100452 RepID=A0A8S3ZP14_9EUPU|nr:unnamed protein product [Candidula unifasciata]
MASSKTQKACFYSDIRDVLKNHRALNVANNNVYDTLLRTLSDCSEVELVVKIVKDLEHCISLLNLDYKPLVGLIMKLNWLDNGPELIKAFQSFMLNLVSAQIFYLKPCLTTLVAMFAQETTKGPDDDGGKRKEDFSHIHSLLKSISQIVPMTGSVLVQILDNRFPYVTKSVSCFENYTQNILLITTYMPVQRLDILEIVVKNMLKLDVRSSRHDISSALSSIMAGTDHVDLMDTTFDMEEVSQVASESSHEADSRLSAALPQAASLDAMLELTFHYVKDQCYTDAKLDWDRTKRLYRELLSVFNKLILPTHASCHVQYIMFYVCSFREVLADGFIDYLWKKVTDPTAESVYRQSAACYIGSFITRSKYLSVKTAKQVVELMVKWIHSYLDRTCDQGAHADLAHHAPFYSVCQSVFYIFCFKHMDFMGMKGYRWAESLNLQRIVTSKLNPLRVCMPIIVSTFASAARLHQLAFCDTVIERNNRYHLPVAASTYSTEGSRQTQLQSYFPFDPYLLPRSCSHIRPLYKEFHGSLPGEDDDAVDEDEDDFLPSDEEDMNLAACDISLSVGKSPSNVLQYGMSPGFKNG